MLSKATHHRAFYLVFSLVLLSYGTARANTVVLGSSGWQAMWDPSLDPYVSVVVDNQTSDTVYIEKAADFVVPPGPGGFPAISIQFQQIAYPAATHIVIEDESIFNHTGVSWTDFHMTLLDHGDAVFNPANTNASAGGTGFHTAPFTHQVFSGGNMVFDMDGFGLGPAGSDAVIPNNTGWFPGDGAFDGELFMDVNPVSSGPMTVFTLKEQPTPEPATLVLVAIGGVFAIHRRRRQTT